jgi:hypothetical protein
LHEGPVYWQNRHLGASPCSSRPSLKRATDADGVQWEAAALYARHTAASRSIASPPFASAAASASATADAFCCLHAARFRSALRSSRRHRDTTASQISSRCPFLCHARTSRSARTRR